MEGRGGLGVRERKAEVRQESDRGAVLALVTSSFAEISSSG